MSEVVLDASVVLAALLLEPGHEAVLALEDTALLSAVNQAEAESRLMDYGFDRSSIDASMGLLNMKVVEFDARQASISSDLRSSTRALGLSLGDRACLALGRQRDAVVLTADRAWSELDTAIDIRVIR